MRRAGAADDDINRGELGFPMIEIDRASTEFVGQILSTIVRAIGNHHTARATTE